MTQVFTENGTVVPVTVIEAGPCPVTAIRDPERDGYSAVQLAFGEVAERKLSKAELGHLKKAGAGPLRTVVEFRDADLGGEEGRLGGGRVTQPGLEVFQIDAERNLLLVKGSVPGSRNGVVEVRGE